MWLKFNFFLGLTLLSSLNLEILNLYEDLAPQISALVLHGGSATTFCIEAEIDIFNTDYVGRSGDIDSIVDLDTLIARVSFTSESFTIVMDKFMADNFVVEEGSDSGTV